MPTNHLTLALLAATTLSSLQAQTTPAPAAPRKTYDAILARLIMPLDVYNAKPGTRIQAYIQQEWSNGACDLRYGALIEGHVSEVTRRTRADRNSSMAVVFDTAACNRHRGTPLKTLVIALLGPDAPQPGGANSLGQNPPLTDTPNPIGAGAGLRNISRASEANRLTLTGHSVPDAWKLGMVVDVPATTLALGKGAEGGTVIAVQNRDVRLEARTLLIMAYVPPTPPETSTP